MAKIAVAAPQTVPEGPRVIGPPHGSCLAGHPKVVLLPWIMAQKRIFLTIRGRVQGVFFRASTQREARRLGITGWVRNKPDGSIELCAEGDEDAIKELSSWANHGPSAARVDHVDVRWRGYTGEFPEFQIVE